MSQLKRKLAKVLLADGIIPGILMACALGGGLGGAMWVDHDLDDAPAVENALMSGYRARLKNLEFLGKYQTSPGQPLSQQWAQIEAKRNFYIKTAEGIGRDILTDFNLNERMVLELSKSYPEDMRDSRYGVKPSYADSMNECRLSYISAGVTSQDDAARSIRECAKDDNNDFILSAPGAGGSLFFSIGFSFNSFLRGL